MQRFSLEKRRERTRIVLVPTMGSLHEGHLSLIRRAKTKAGKNGLVVVTIFVNRTQFGPGEDFGRYPRTERRDLSLCRDAGADVVFIPDDADIYPASTDTRFSCHVEETKLSKGMEGASRPSHFRGVTTVVAKLFNLTQPDIAIFGAKDFQQAAVIRRMVRDLDFPVKIEVAPTVREPDGLAMSSRNAYLTPAERKQATVLYRAIALARKNVRERGPFLAGKLKKIVATRIALEPDAELDYVDFFNPETLQPEKRVSKGAQMALAVRIGQTRLIDNGQM